MRKMLFLEIVALHLLAQAWGIAPRLQGASAVIHGGAHFGGNAHDEAHAASYDSRGNLVVVGSTASADFPATRGEVFQDALRGDLDAYVASFDPSGKLRFATYFGGTAEERGLAVALDAADDIVIAGLTTSADLEVTNDSYLTGIHGDRATADGFVAILSADVSQLLYATYLGGNSIEEANGVAIERDGRILVSGLTQSPSFPVTGGALQPF